MGLFLLRLLLFRQFHDEAVQFLWQTLLVSAFLAGTLMAFREVQRAVF